MFFSLLLWAGGSCTFFLQPQEQQNEKQILTSLSSQTSNQESAKLVSVSPSAIAIPIPAISLSPITSTATIAKSFSTTIVGNIVIPEQKKRPGFTNSVNDICVSGNYAYITTDEGLLVVNIHNPSSPVIVANVDTLGTPGSIWVSGYHAYVTIGRYGLQVVDIHNPSSPVISSSLYIPNANRDVPLSGGGYAYVKDVTVNGNYAYVTDSFSGLQVVDIHNPSSPVIVANLPMPDPPNYPPGFGNANETGGLYVSGDYAYVANNFSGLQVVDIHNPSSPVIVANVDTDGYAQNVYVSGDYAYIADSFSLQVVDVHNPSSPMIVGNIDKWPPVFSVSTEEIPILNHMQLSDKLKQAFKDNKISLSDSLVVKSVKADKLWVITGQLDMWVTIKNEDGKLNIYDSIKSGSLFVTNVSVKGNRAYITSDGNLYIVNIQNPSLAVIVANVDTGGYAGNVYINGDYAYVLSSVKDNQSSVQIVGI